MNPNYRPTSEFLAAFRQVRRPVIAGHVTPDADCLASMLGLAVSMRERGIDASVGLPAGCVAKRLEFMFELSGDVPRVDGWPGNGHHDALIVLDTANEKRVNLKPELDLSVVTLSFNVDHHITNTDFGTHNWVDPHATSASELAARLLAELDCRPTPVVASLLYAGIHGDTAGFSLPNTNADSLRAAADLLSAGADVCHIGERMCRSLGRQDFDLLRRVYDQTRVSANGQIAYSYLSYRDITESGCTADDIDDQVSIPRSLKGVRIAMLFTEGEPGVIRINLRGEGKVTVVEIAQRFGGGGHSQSAGVRMRGRSMDDVIREIVTAAQEHLHQIGQG